MKLHEKGDIFEVYDNSKMDWSLLRIAKSIHISEVILSL